MHRVVLEARLPSEAARLHDLPVLVLLVGRARRPTHGGAGLTGLVGHPVADVVALLDQPTALAAGGLVVDEDPVVAVAERDRHPHRLVVDALVAPQGLVDVALDVGAVGPTRQDLRRLLGAPDRARHLAHPAVRDPLARDLLRVQAVGTGRVEPGRFVAVETGGRGRQATAVVGRELPQQLLVLVGLADAALGTRLRVHYDVRAAARVVARHVDLVGPVGIVGVRHRPRRDPRRELVGHLRPRARPLDAHDLVHQAFGTARRRLHRRRQPLAVADGRHRRVRVRRQARVLRLDCVGVVEVLVATDRVQPVVVAPVAADVGRVAHRAPVGRHRLGAERVRRPGRGLEADHLEVGGVVLDHRRHAAQVFEPLGVGVAHVQVVAARLGVVGGRHVRVVMRHAFVDRVPLGPWAAGRRSAGVARLCVVGAQTNASSDWGACDCSTPDIVDPRGKQGIGPKRAPLDPTPLKSA